MKQSFDKAHDGLPRLGNQPPARFYDVPMPNGSTLRVPNARMREVIDTALSRVSISQNP